MERTMNSGKKRKGWKGLLSLGLCLALWATAAAQPKMENLSRGLIAIKTNSGVYLSWRLLGHEAFETVYDIYRDGTKITSTPVADKTNYVDGSGTTASTYQIVSSLNGNAIDTSAVTSVWRNNVYRVDLDVPPADGAITYSPNDCSAADLNGDGTYEIIVKWHPSNAKDNAHSGATSNEILDAYTLDGTRLWRIDLGQNIRAGSHYTQFIVYDLDGDGKAEIACKTAPGTKDGTGNYIRFGPAATADHSAEYRNSSGRVLDGPEYLTLFNGETGAEMSTLAYNPARGNVGSWGDDYGNRVDRFLAGLAYLDGENPSLIMARGYYTRTVVAAYDWDGTEFTTRWVFDSNKQVRDQAGNPYAGQGNHQLSIADVDGDGKQEIIYGSMTIDDDGVGLYSTGLGHGDALHVSDMDPDRPGLEVFMVHEDTKVPYGISYRDAATGEVIWGFDADFDVGRGVAADINPNHRGFEAWSSRDGNVYNSDGAVISTSLPQSAGGGSSYNHVVWWDGDLLREILDRTVLNKYNYETGGSNRLWTLYNEGVSSNNGTKSNPCLTADLFGDWREEIVLRSSDDKQLVIFTTTDESPHKIYTLMHDPTYRVAIAWQNVGYNQPPHTGYYLGAGMDTPTQPNIQFADKATVSKRYNLVVNQEGLGTVTPVSGNYLGGNYTLTATPEVNWVFDGWTGDTTSTLNEITVALDADKTYTANFSMANPNGWNAFEAESGTRTSGAIETTYPGYSGTGYVNVDNANREEITIPVYVPYAANYTVKVFYANGTSSDLLWALSVDGRFKAVNLPMPGTGSWRQWSTQETSVALAEGFNTIGLFALTAGGLANIDKIELKVEDATDVEEHTVMSLVKCYPSSVDDYFTVEYPGNIGENVQITVIDVNGKVHLSQQVSVLQQGESVTINASNLSAGSYLVNIQTDAGTSVQKIIKQ